jgi:phospholipase/carboxylesterase
MAKITGPSIAAASGKAEQLVVLCHGYGADGNDLIGLAPHWQRMLPHAELMRGVESAAPVLNEFIDEELAKRGLDGSQLALVGFSQGTMMSLQVGLRRATPPAAIVGYSGALAGGDRLKAELKGHPPVLLVHGDADEMLPVSRMHDAIRVLGDAGLSVQWHVSHGVGHGIDPEGLEIGGRFLRDAFAGAFAAAATGD